MVLTLPAINDGGSWFNEGACHLNTATQAVEAPFPQAFASPKRSPFPSAPRYGLFLASSDRQSDREVGMRPPRRFYAAYHHCAHEHVETLVLLPTGTLYRGTQRNTIGLSVCTRTRTSILHSKRNIKRFGLGSGLSVCGRRAFHPPFGKPVFYPHFTIGFCETASEAYAVFDCFTIPSVATGLTSHFKKMWVKDRLKRQGAFKPALCKDNIEVIEPNSALRT